MSTGSPLEAMRASDKMKIFISHPHEDLDVAAALREAILELDRGLIDVFLDQSHIAEGKQITPTITDALSGASFFIGVGTDATRGPYAWCGLELGYFLAIERHTSPSVVCLFHDEVPDVFHPYKNVKLVSLAPRHTTEFSTDVFAVDQAPLTIFFKNLSNQFNKMFPARDAGEFFNRALDWQKKSAIAVTEAYFKCLQTRVAEVWYPQKRLEIQIPSRQEELSEIPDDACVVIGNAAYSVLNLGFPSGSGDFVKRSWPDFCRLVVRQSGGEHLPRILSEIVGSVLPFASDPQNDLVFLAPNQKRYRVVLVKHQLYGNGRRDFIFNLIETLKPVGGGDQKSTMLTAAIMLASRYRSVFLEKDARYGRGRFDEMGEEDLILQTKQMLKDLQRINFDAAEEGFNDVSALITLLGESEAVKALFARWWPPLNALEDAATAFSMEPGAETRAALIRAHNTFLDVSDTVNHKFMSLCLRTYQRLIDTREGIS